MQDPDRAAGDAIATGTHALEHGPYGRPRIWGTKIDSELSKTGWARRMAMQPTPVDRAPRRVWVGRHDGQLRRARAAVRPVARDRRSPGPDGQGSGLVVGQVEGLEDHPALSAPFGEGWQPPDDRPTRTRRRAFRRARVDVVGSASFPAGIVAVRSPSRTAAATWRSSATGSSDLVAQTVADHRQQRDGHGHRRMSRGSSGRPRRPPCRTVDDQRADDHRNGGRRDQCRSRCRDEHADRPRCRPAVPHRAVPIAASRCSGTRHRRVDDVCGRGRSSGKSGQDDRLVADVHHSGGGSSARVGRRIGLPDTGR